MRTYIKLRKIGSMRVYALSGPLAAFCLACPVIIRKNICSLSRVAFNRDLALSLMQNSQWLFNSRAAPSLNVFQRPRIVCLIEQSQAKLCKTQGREGSGHSWPPPFVYLWWSGGHGGTWGQLWVASLCRALGSCWQYLCPETEHCDSP